MGSRIWAPEFLRKESNILKGPVKRAEPYKCDIRFVSRIL